MRKGTLRVITVTGKCDYVKRSHLSYYIKRGYVVALYPGEETKLTFGECEELAGQGIAFIYDGDARRKVFRPEE